LGEIVVSTVRVDDMSRSVQRVVELIVGLRVEKGDVVVVKKDCC